MRGLPFNLSAVPPEKLPIKLKTRLETDIHVVETFYKGEVSVVPSHRECTAQKKRKGKS